MSKVAPIANSATEHNPLLSLLDLSHRARTASSLEELEFLAVNDTRALCSYRQAALWFSAGGTCALSGVVQVERNAPYVHWLNRLCSSLDTPAGGSTTARVITCETLPAELAAQWAQWLPRTALWLPLPVSAGHPGSSSGGLLLAGEQALPADVCALLEEWLHAWRHAWLGHLHVPPWSLTRLGSGLRHWLGNPQGKPWWRRRSYQLALLAAGALFFPVRLSVLAPGELVAANPAVIRAPLDGVIGQFHVRPNEAIKAGQLLFSFDQAALASRLEVARQTLETAQTKYRQFAQLALSDSSSKAQMMLLYGEISERRTEAEFLQEQLRRSHVLAPQDGIALFDDPSEWIGRPVLTGERVLRLAAPEDVEIELWLGIGDAIPLDEHAPVRLYLAATPFNSMAGQVRYIGHDAVPRPDGSYAYRLRATLEQSSGQRIGLKGTAKLYGAWVPLGYWVMRRPLATIRQFIAL